MRCPNCHSIVGDSWGICRYCGFDVGRYMEELGDGSVPTEVSGVRNREIPETLYRNEDFRYYKAAYTRERRRNDRYRRNIYIGLLCAALCLNIIQLVIIIATNL